jgi:hypothetical protein
MKIVQNGAMVVMREGVRRHIFGGGVKRTDELETADREPVPSPGAAAPVAGEYLRCAHRNGTYQIEIGRVVRVSSSRSRSLVGISAAEDE